jgi:hypothetical protein
MKDLPVPRSASAPTTQDVNTRRRAALQVLMTLVASTRLAACGSGDSPSVAGSTTAPTEPTNAAPPQPAPTTAVPPSPAPSPIPAPPPPPPSPPGPAKILPVGSLGWRILDNSKLVMFRRYNSGTRYNRFIPNVVLGASAEIEFNADSRTTAPTVFHAKSYTLTCDGQNLASVSPPSGSIRAAFQVDLSAISDGWHIFDIVPSEGGETPVPFWMYVLKGGSPGSQAWAPTQTGSFGHQREEKWVAKWGRVPAQITAAGWPIALRTTTHFSHPAKPAELFRRDLAPGINGDPPYLHRTDAGMLTCLGVHGYAWDNIIAKLPPVIIRDGPRGIGTVVGPTHVEIGSAAPAGSLRGNVYFTDSWRLGKVKPNGEVVTLVGYRHTMAGLELVGDWSAIPAERRGFHELWGLAWDKRTFPIDESAAPIPSENNEKPHVTGIVAFVADSQNNRVCKILFDARSHSTPAKVTEFLTGLQDPWDVVYHDGVLFVSERMSHRIAAYDATTGQYLRTVVQGAALATVGKYRYVNTLSTLSAIRAERCVAPEGLYIMDDWLYFGSIAMQQVRRVHIKTGELQVAATLAELPPKTNYFKIAVSDGTFGPRGSIFVSTWDVERGGGPYCFLSDGTPWSIWVAGSHPFTEGRGGRWRGLGYSTCVGSGSGRLLCGSADYGLVEITLAQSGDPAMIDHKLYEAGKVEYEEFGFRLTHGIDGYGHYGYPLPWGRSGPVDYYLTQHGHRKPAT